MHRRLLASIAIVAGLALAPSASAQPFDTAAFNALQYRIVGPNRGGRSLCSTGSARIFPLRLSWQPIAASHRLLFGTIAEQKAELSGFIPGGVFDGTLRSIGQRDDVATIPRWRMP